MKSLHKQLFIVESAQQGVQRTAGSLRVLQTIFWLQVFSTSSAFSAPAPCPPLTEAVRRLNRD
jgi:hypothetical protein